MREDYFISGSIRMPLLIVEITIFVICIEIAGLFLFNYFTQEKTTRDIRYFGFLSLFLGYAFFILSYIIADFYASQTELNPILQWQERSDRLFHLNIGNLILIGAIVVFISFMERYKIYFRKRYFFTKVCIVLLVIYLGVFCIDMQYTQFLSTILFWPIFVLFLTLYIIDLTKLIEDREKKISIVFLKYMSLFIALFIGYFLSRDLIVDELGKVIRLVGALIQILSLIGLNLFFRKLPPFSEFTWQEKIEELYLIHQSGVCIIHKKFKEENSKDKEQLVSSALSSINMILNDLIKEKGNGFSVINKENHILTIYTSQFLSAVVFSTEDLDFIKNHLEKFVNRVEVIYRNILVNWEGDISIFQPIESLVKNIFQNQSK